jgi:hypothetical protein
MDFQGYISLSQKRYAIRPKNRGYSASYQKLAPRIMRVLSIFSRDLARLAVSWNWAQLSSLSLHFNEETSEEIFHQGITSPKDLLELDNEYLKHFKKTIKSSPHPDDHPSKLIMGIKICQNLDTLQVWIKLRDLCNQSYLPAAWTVTSLDGTKERKSLTAFML